MYILHCHQFTFYLIFDQVHLDHYNSYLDPIPVDEDEPWVWCKFQEDQVSAFRGLYHKTLRIRNYGRISVS